MEVTKAARTLAPKAVQNGSSIFTVPVNPPRDREYYSRPGHIKVGKLLSIMVLFLSYTLINMAWPSAFRNVAGNVFEVILLSTFRANVRG